MCVRTHATEFNHSDLQNCLLKGIASEGIGRKSPSVRRVPPNRLGVTFSEVSVSQTTENVTALFTPNSQRNTFINQFKSPRFRKMGFYIYIFFFYRMSRSNNPHESPVFWPAINIFWKCHYNSTNASCHITFSLGGGNKKKDKLQEFIKFCGQTPHWRRHDCLQIWVDDSGPPLEGEGEPKTTNTTLHGFFLLLFCLFYCD